MNYWTCQAKIESSSFLLLEPGLEPGSLGDAIPRSRQRLVPVEDDQFHHDRRSGVPSDSDSERFVERQLCWFEGLNGRIDYTIYIYIYIHTLI